MFFKKSDNNIDNLQAVPNWRVGVSLASDWSWGFSIAVGFSIMYTKGILPCLMWMIGNILAVPLLAFIQVKMPKSKNWPTFLPMLLLFVMMGYFAITINMQAILVGLGGGKDFPTYVFLDKAVAIPLVLALAGIIIAYVYRGGLKIIMLTGLGSYLLQIGAVILLAAIGFFLGTDNNVQWLLPGGAQWGMFGFWGILLGALTHGHQWQKFSAIKEKNILKCGLWAGLFFGIYMVFVFIAGYFYSQNPILGIIMLALMIFLAISTIDSTISGWVYILDKFSLRKRGYAATLATLIVFSWPLINNQTLAEIWTKLAIIRTPVLVVFILVTLFLTMKKSQTERLQKLLEKYFFIVKR